MTEHPDFINGSLLSRISDTIAVTSSLTGPDYVYRVGIDGAVWRAEVNPYTPGEWQRVTGPFPPAEPEGDPA
jgi:hypothetical protein